MVEELRTNSLNSRARVIANDDAVAAVSCRSAIARHIVENLDDFAPPWIDNGNAVVDHGVFIVAVLRHDPYDIGRQSARLHARRQPSADVDLDIKVLAGGRPVAPQLIDDLPALIVVCRGRGRLAVRLIRSLAGPLARRCVARPGRLLLGRLGRLVTLIFAIAIHLLLGMLLGIGGLIRVQRAVLLGLTLAASQLLLGLLLLVDRLLGFATLLPVLLLRRAKRAHVHGRAGQADPDFAGSAPSISRPCGSCACLLLSDGVGGSPRCISPAPPFCSD